MSRVKMLYFIVKTFDDLSVLYQRIYQRKLDLPIDWEREDMKIFKPPPGVSVTGSKPKKKASR